MVKKMRGSIALINLLIISAVLMMLVVVASDVSVTGSYQYLNYYSNQNLFHVAEACLEETIVRIERDTSVSLLSLDMAEASCVVSISGSMSKSVLIDVNSGNYSQSFGASLTVGTQGQANNVSLVSWQKN